MAKRLRVEADHKPAMIITRRAVRADKLVYVANVVGKKMKWNDEQKYFTPKKLDGIIDAYS